MLLCTSVVTTVGEVLQARLKQPIQGGCSRVPCLGLIQLRHSDRGDQSDQKRT